MSKAQLKTWVDWYLAVRMHDPLFAREYLAALRELEADVVAAEASPAEYLAKLRELEALSE